MPFVKLQVSAPESYQWLRAGSDITVFYDGVNATSTQITTTYGSQAVLITVTAASANKGGVTINAARRVLAW